MKPYQTQFPVLSVSSQRAQPRLRGACKGLLSLLWIALSMLMAGTTRGEDVMYYELFKGQAFTQSETNSPGPAAEEPYLFEVFLYPLGYPYTYLPYVSDPEIETPEGISHALTLVSQTNANRTVMMNFAFTDSAASESALDTAYGAGAYTLAYHGTQDGAATIVVALDADDFPPAPALSNLAAAQFIDPSNNFALTFAPWAAVGSNNYVQLTVLDSGSNVVFATPALFALYPEAPLNASNTTMIIITNGTLKANQAYTATLTFTAVTTNFDDGIPFIWGGFFSQTTFIIQTQSPETNNPPPPPPPPASPTSLTNTLLSLTVSPGEPFPGGRAYQIFTTATGSNYFVLGNAGGGFNTGSYVYTQTGTNTGVVMFTDAQIGNVSLQLTFTAAGAGTFVLTSSSGLQKGAFTETPDYITLNAPNLFLPTFTNGQFQAFLSGDPGVNYTVESSSDLSAWSSPTNLNVQNLTTNVADSPSSAARYYRATVKSIAFAPAAITGASFNSTVTSGFASFASSGAFQFEAGTNGNDYLILDLSGATNGSGTYTYAVTGSNTALISYTDSTSGAICGEQLVFTSAAAGYFYTTNAGASGFQSGTFKMTDGPVLFLGAVKFTPDTARGVSTNFPGDGTPVSLSVTDAKGYMWTLNIPSNALQTSATISMTPFASGIDSSGAALPVLTGVQLGPEGMQFCDGLTLTLTTPAPLGPQATLLMGAGDGTGLALTQTTNQGNSYAMTLFHFSLGAASDSSESQALDQLLQEAKDAYNQAVKDLLNVEKQKTMPPEPPDYEFNCSGSNPAAEARVDQYIFNLFSEERAVVQNLLSAARALELLGGGEDTADLNSLVEQFFSTECLRKVNAIYNNWKGNPLKYYAYSKVATSISSQDLLFGGEGVPDVFQQLDGWLQANVLPRYWNKLRAQHDYTMAGVLLKLERLNILLLSDASGEDAFIQDVASAYTFQSTINLSVAGPVSGGGGNFNLTAQGTIKITGDPKGVFPMSGSNNVNYTAGSWSGAGETLELPLSYPQNITVTIDTCSNLNATFYMDQIGAEYNGKAPETWTFPAPLPPEIEDYLEVGFSKAFGTTDIDPGNQWGAAYAFPLQFQNLSAQAVSTNFSGPDGQFGGSVITSLNIVLQHKPQ
jgi:hypothetical protein